MTLAGFENCGFSFQSRSEPSGGILLRARTESWRLSLSFETKSISLCKAGRASALEGRRKTNAVDATGALVPRERKYSGRSAVVAPDAARDQSATTSKFWGVSWSKQMRRWKAQYKDANGKSRSVGYFDDEEEAAAR